MEENLHCCGWDLSLEDAQKVPSSDGILTNDHTKECITQYREQEGCTDCEIGCKVT